MLLFFLVLLFVVIIIFLYVFFAPLYIEIDTSQDICRFRFHWLFVAELKLTGDSPHVELKILGLKKRIDFMGGISKGQVKGKKDEKKGRTFGRASWKKIKAVLKTFKWNICNISVDTGDQQLNGILFPIVYLMAKYTGKNISINFEGDTFAELQIKNTLARISWAYLRN